MLSKIKTTIIALVATITSVMAQSPNMINYQGVAHNANGTAIANQAIKVRLKIHNATTGGTVQYSEVRNVTTDATGLFNILIGSTGAVSTTGSWAGITWDNGVKYLQVEMDPTGGTTYINMGTQQLVSVPYAQHAKSAASLSNGATVSPSQIATAGASANQVLQFNGTNWAPASIASGSGLTLPYIIGDANLVSFGIINSSAVGGTAIYGQTTTNNVNANGIKGEATAANGNGVLGKASGATSFGVLGENTTGIGIKGTTTSSSTSGTAILGLNNGTQGSGILGIANFASGNGVYGSSTNGTGVAGYSGNNKAIFGSSISGTGLYGHSISGYALQLSGNVKISGGNTTPGAGKVLTSDVAGNATWQPVGLSPKIAFSAYQPTTVNYTSGAYIQVGFITESYDISNNFDINTDIFTVPINGVYHFEGATSIYMTSNTVNMDYATIALVLKRNGTETIYRETRSIVESHTFGSIAAVFISCDASLQTGDQIYLKVLQSNSHADPASTTFYSNPAHFFNGHIVFAY